MCRLFAGSKLKACEAEKAEALESLAMLIDSYGQLEAAYRQSQINLVGKDEIIFGLQEQLRPIDPPSEQWPLTSGELLGMLHDLLGTGVSIDLADENYKITTYSEMARFIRQAQVYKMRWQKDAPDCDDFTRKIKGELVCPGWWWQPPLDCWFRVDGGGHSELLTVLVDDREEDRPVELFLIECQAVELFQMAAEVLLDNGLSRVWKINH